MAATLYVLVHGPAPIPRSARDIAFTTDDLLTAPALSHARPDPGMPPDAEPAADVYAAPRAYAPQIDMADTDLRMAPGVAYPSRRLRNKFRSWFYGQVPTREEIARYAGRG
jgi:hypothetical protein